MTTIATLPPRARERRFSWAGRAAVAALVALVVYGLWAFSYEVSNGLGVTAMRNIQIWGAYIAAFMFFVGASAGGMIVATIGSIFHVEKLEHLSRYAIWTSLVTIIVAGLSIFPDLGEPQRFWHMFVYANWTSPMIWDVIVVLGYGFFNVVYLWLHMRSDLAGRYRWLGFSAGHGSARAERRYGRIVLGFAYFMLPLAFALHSITAWIIGTQPSHPYWYSTVMAPLFISSALVSGIALVLAVLLVLERQGRLEIGADAQRWLSGFLAVTIAINLFLLIAEAVTVSTGRQPGDWAGLHQLLAGSYAWIYWMEIGTALVALALVAIPRGRASRRFVALAAALGLVSVAFERIQLIVGGLRFPNIGYAPGISLGTPSQVTTTGVPTASSFVQVAHYGPTWLEWSIVVGLCALWGLLLVLGVRFLPLGTPQMTRGEHLLPAPSGTADEEQRGATPTIGSEVPVAQPAGSPPAPAPEPAVPTPAVPRPAVPTPVGTLHPAAPLHPPAGVVGGSSYKAQP